MSDEARKNIVKHYSKQQALDFLRSVSVMNLAVSSNGRPMSSVLLFHVDDDFTFYFGTHDDSYKAVAIRNNPKVGFSVWEHNKMLVQADGIAEEILEPVMMNLVLNDIVSATNNIKNFWPPVLRIRGNGYAVFSIKTTWMRALDLQSDAITEKELPFTMIVED